VGENTERREKRELCRISKLVLWMQHADGEEAME